MSNETALGDHNELIFNIQKDFTFLKLYFRNLVFWN